MSENSYGARLGGGKKLKAAVATFLDFEPQTGQNSPIELAEQIVALEEMEPEVVAVNNDYRDAAFDRKLVFYENDDSIAKVLSPILSFVSGKFGKDSMKYKQVQSLVAKLRGVRIGRVNTSPDAVTHSVSQMGYTSITMNFKTLITTLQGFGIAYAPTNVNILIINLIDLRILADAKNEQVDTAYSLMVPKVDARAAAYDTFSVMCQCMKNLMKSQYGVKSYQWKIVKGISI